jgi:lipopolysaccharide export system protein LptA
MKYYFLSTLFLLGCYLAGAQDTTTVDSSVIEVLFIKHYKQKEEADGVWKYMDEDVHLRQGAVDMWFDKGLIRPIKQVEAYGSVRIQQDDTINIYSDSLWYDGLRETAVLRSNVVLEDPRMRMETAEMDYDTRTKIARFPAAKIISDSAVLVSKQGYYDVGSQMMHFMDSVRIDHPKYNFKADTLRYNTERDIAYFDGPTTFYNKDKVVYCEDGFFDTKGDYAELKEKAYYYSTAEGKRQMATRLFMMGRRICIILLGMRIMKMRSVL